jgi:excisionase family DNA binding protein
MPKQLPNLPPLDPRQRYSITEACGYLRISRDYLYSLIREGEVRTIRDGKRQFVPGSVIARRSALP